ncbi:MAG: tetratricopeptide repeat protein, partial [Candidatus Omnitrophica bacterium]|nr:tetratricopeptide repeat protein [Candidatus Omnitrophota bacterium]
MRSIKPLFLLYIAFVLVCPAWAQTASSVAAAATSSEELVRLSWKASNEGNIDALNKLYDVTIAAYDAKARLQAGRLTGFPPRDQAESYRIMDDVATVMFIKAETLMRQGKNDEAGALFEQVSAQYPWAQSWDPSRGAFWSIKEKAQASIKTMSGQAPGQETAIDRKVPRTMPHLAFGGKRVVDYLKYGRFLNVGTKDYHYQVTDPKGLKAAAGECVYPNLTDMYQDPAYKKALKEGRLQGSHWDFVNTDDMQAAIFKWAAAPEPWGIRLFYMGVIFEKAKMYDEAIKAYHAVVVYFPDTVSWTYWQTPWYPGQAAIAKIQYIIRTHPELKLGFKGAKIRILNSFDNDPKNDVTITTPGTVTRASAKLRVERMQVPLGEPVKTVGTGLVRLIKYSGGHWQMTVGGEPFLIKGMSYTPNKVGQSPDNGTLTNWMQQDENANGLIDAPYEAWVDKDHNNQQDPDEPSVGDFVLMKD